MISGNSQFFCNFTLSIYELRSLFTFQDSHALILSHFGELSARFPQYEAKRNFGR